MKQLALSYDANITTELAAPTLHEFVWLDIETTGLLDANPGGAYSDGRILEVAFVLADDGVDGTFEPVTEESIVIAYDTALTMSDYVRKMHTKNGLLAACRLTPDFPDEATADDYLCFLLDQHCGPDSGFTLAGNSVHFDLDWLRARMPKSAARFSHRVFDVSTLLRTAGAWGIGVNDRGEPAHRALDDVHESLRLAKAWRDAVRA